MWRLSTTSTTRHDVAILRFARGWTADLEPGMNSVIAGQQKTCFLDASQFKQKVRFCHLVFLMMSRLWWRLRLELWTLWTRAIEQISSHSSVDITVSALKEADHANGVALGRDQTTFSLSGVLDVKRNCAQSFWEQVHQVFLTSATASWFIAGKQGKFAPSVL